MTKKSSIKNLSILLGLILITYSGCYSACSNPTSNPNKQKISSNKSKKQINNNETIYNNLKPLPPVQIKSPLVGKNAYKIADVAEVCVNSVVNIYSTKTIRFNKNQFAPFFNDPFFNNFFGHKFKFPNKQKQKNLGSGVIVSADGLILTNNHVVDHADTIKVKLSDGRTFDAKLIGSDAKSDLALIRLKGKVNNLKPLKLGDSDKIRLGEIVLAIGSPFGLGSTVTMGIISAKGRANLGIVDYEDFIQTDAAINPGNSGGALVNLKGEVIGINTAIISKTGGNQGVGFAIPSNMAKQVMDSLLKYGKVVRGWLGVLIQPVDSEMAKMLRLPVSTGVLIGDVVNGGPADKAGLKRGDVIISINGEKVKDTGHLRNIIAMNGSNKKISLEIIRSGKKITKQVKLGELPEKGEQIAVNNKAQKETYGLKVSDLTDKSRAYYKVPKEFNGVVVISVAQSSAAESAGLKEGDVIIEINRQGVNNINKFNKLMSKPGNKLLLIYRKGHTLFTILKD